MLDLAPIPAYFPDVNSMRSHYFAKGYRSSLIKAAARIGDYRTQGGLFNSRETGMTFEDWKAKQEIAAQRTLERRKLESNFNAEIVRRHKAGETKDEIVTRMGISRELFNRAMRAG